MITTPNIPKKNPDWWTSKGKCSTSTALNNLNKLLGVLNSSPSWPEASCLSHKLCFTSAESQQKQSVLYMTAMEPGIHKAVQLSTGTMHYLMLSYFNKTPMLARIIIRILNHLLHCLWNFCGLCIQTNIYKVCWQLV